LTVVGSPVKQKIRRQSTQQQPKKKNQQIETKLCIWGSNLRLQIVCHTSPNAQLAQEVLVQTLMRQPTSWVIWAALLIGCAPRDICFNQNLALNVQKVDNMLSTG